jgi:hypothetical protein
MLREAFKVDDQFSSTFAKARGEATKTVSGFAKVRKEMQSAALGVGGLALAITGATIAIRKMIESLRDATRTADNIAKLTGALGVSADWYQKMTFAAERSGVASQTFDTILRKVNARMGDLAKGSAEAVDGFKKYGLGIDESNISGKTAADVIDAMIARFEELGMTSAQKAQAMTEVLGGVRGEMGNIVNLFDEGAEGVEKLKDKAEDLGLVMSGRLLQAAEDFEDQWLAIEKSIDTATNKIKLELLIAMGDVEGKASGIAGWLETVADMIHIATIDGGKWHLSMQLLLGTIFQITDGVAELLKLLGKWNKFRAGDDSWGQGFIDAVEDAQAKTKGWIKDLAGVEEGAKKIAGALQLESLLADIARATTGLKPSEGGGTKPTDEEAKAAASLAKQLAELDKEIERLNTVGLYEANVAVSDNTNRIQTSTDDLTKILEEMQEAEQEKAEALRLNTLATKEATIASVASAFGAVGGGVKSAVGQFGGPYGAAIASMMALVEQMGKQDEEGRNEFASGIIDEIKGILEGLVALASQLFANEMVANLMAAMVDFIVQLIPAIIKGITTAIPTFINALVSAFKNIDWGAWLDPTSWFEGWNFQSGTGLSSVPRTGMYRLHRGEEVKSRSEVLGRRGRTGTTIHNHIQGNLWNAYGAQEDLAQAANRLGFDADTVNS